jgi:leucyl/phenylalanyl-tRNA--protein transferase
VSKSDKTALEHVLDAYRCGLFPMAESRDSDEFYWYDPPQRGQLSITDLHIPKRLKRTALSAPYRITINQDFAGVIDGCAAQRNDRKETWINHGIRNLFIALHHEGHAHSVECYQGTNLVGGLYGLALGGAFMGESMFSRARDASKIALIGLCAQLWKQGFTLLDTQYINDHLTQFGAYEIPKDDYLTLLHKALTHPCTFTNKSPDTIDIETIKQYINK